MFISVRNPRTGDKDYQLQQCAPETLAALATTARAAQHDWYGAGIEHRVAVLGRWYDSLVRHRQALLDALCLDTGRLNESELEINSVMDSLKSWCQQAPALLANTTARPSVIAGLSIGGRTVPYSVTGVISPWNFPMLLSLIDAIPALLCGSSVLIKPSEITPRFIAPLVKTIEEVPELAAVLHFIAGDGSLGAALIKHVDLVVFTGSVATGKKVALAAAERLIPSFLELGGKDPAIVCADAGLERAAAAIAWGGLANAGQSCLSIERIYVERSVHDDFLGQLLAKVKGLRLNFQSITEGDIGPLISASQALTIQQHLDDAKARGAIIHCGGVIESHKGGLWCQPTVLSNVDHSMKIMTEESFGPLLPVMAADDVEQCIALANDSPFGLSGAVFAGSNGRAIAVAEQLQVGAISINDCALTAVMHEGEKQSFKSSGLGGSRMGTVSIQRFLRKQALLINDQQQWDPWWFHHKGKRI